MHWTYDDDDDDMHQFGRHMSACTLHKLTQTHTKSYTHANARATLALVLCARLLWYSIQFTTRWQTRWNRWIDQCIHILIARSARQFIFIVHPSPSPPMMIFIITILSVVFFLLHTQQINSSFPLQTNKNHRPNSNLVIDILLISRWIWIQYPRNSLAHLWRLAFAVITRRRLSPELIY